MWEYQMESKYAWSLPHKAYSLVEETQMLMEEWNTCEIHATGKCRKKSVMSWEHISRGHWYGRTASLMNWRKWKSASRREHSSVNKNKNKFNKNGSGAPGLEPGEPGGEGDGRVGRSNQTGRCRPWLGFKGQRATSTGLHFRVETGSEAPTVEEGREGGEKWPFLDNSFSPRLNFKTTTLAIAASRLPVYSLFSRGHFTSAHSSHATAHPSTPSWLGPFARRNASCSRMLSLSCF